MYQEFNQKSALANSDMKQIVDYCNSLQERIVQNRNKNKDQAQSGVEKLIYSTDKLLHLITKRRLIEHEI